MKEENLIELIQKYDSPGPRYTSYPAVPHWNGLPKKEKWLQALNRDFKDGIDLYIHIPFCQSLCRYCGCNRLIKRDRSWGREYVGYLKKEWEIYLRNIEENSHQTLKINSIHLGGGTPTFLDPIDLQQLLSLFKPFTSKSFKGAAEIDPRVTQREHINIFKDFNFTRFSLGVQDFDPEVQKACGRIQPFEMVEESVSLLRNAGAKEINFDLIYGLPLQTRDSIKRTIQLVKKLKPETIALYGYAHVPWVAPAQKLLEKYSIPKGFEKRTLYDYARVELDQMKYKEIGLDHFSLEENSLWQAYSEGQLKRNFMGYTTQVSPVTLGLGVSSISQSPQFFVQNHKDLKKYYDALDRGQLPLFHGHTMSDQDLIISRMIQNLFCKGHTQVNTSPYEASFGRLVMEKLIMMNKDGLIEWKNKEMNLTKLGQIFLRNIAMIFDPNLQSNDQRFSRTV